MEKGMGRRSGAAALRALAIGFLCAGRAFPAIIDITDTGAKPGGAIVNTAAIQAAIDGCEGKGDTVLVPAGTFLASAIAMKSGVTLMLAKGAVLSGTTLKADYAGHAFVWGKGLRDIAVIGEGVIDGNGGAPDFQCGDGCVGRPRILMFEACRNVTVTGVELRESAFWTAYFKACVHVRISGVSINSVVNFNNDGLDIDSRDVVVTDCTIETDDDALCLKSNVTGVPCDSVVVRRCTVASSCNAVKFGTASFAGFTRIDIRDIVIRPPAAYNSRRKRQYALAGIALESVDGGRLEGVNISDVTMTGIMTPIFLKLGDRKTPVGSFKDVTLARITAFPNSLICSNLTGLPGGPYLENVSISDMLVHLPGKGTAADAALAVPEKNSGYPEILMFGIPAFPVYAMYGRHLRGLKLRNIQFNLLAPDARPAMRFEDVTGLDTAGIRFTALPLSDFPGGTGLHSGGAEAVAGRMAPAGATAEAVDAAGRWMGMRSGIGYAGRYGRPARAPLTR